MTVDRPFGLVLPRGGITIPGGGSFDIVDVQHMREVNLDNNKVLQSISLTTSLAPAELWAELVDIGWTRLLSVAVGSSVYPIYVDSSWISVRVVNGGAIATTIFFSGKPAEKRC